MEEFKPLHKCWFKHSNKIVAYKLSFSLESWSETKIESRFLYNFEWLNTEWIILRLHNGIFRNSANLKLCPPGIKF